jgi:hypothetical protein
VESRPCLKQTKPNQDKGKLRYTEADSKRINRCRIYLRAEFVSDICNVTGTHVRDASFKLTEEGRNITNELWPRQPRPGPIHRRVWKRFIREICNDNKSLIQTLWQWKTEICNKWQAYYDRVNHRVVTTDNFISWKVWSLEQRRWGWIATNEHGMMLEQHQTCKLEPADT